MAKKPLPDPPDQSFSNTERLYRRVRRDNVRRGGKATLLAFALPDMSVNREKHGTAEEARRGYDKADWGVAAFIVADIPPRTNVPHLDQICALLARHVPEPGNFAHSEVRVWRKVAQVWVLITDRNKGDFRAGDPDRNAARHASAALLDPDFHMRWRKRMALAAKMVLPCGDGSP